MYIAKLMVVGEGRAGKTSTVRSLLGQDFNPEWDSTVGAHVQHAKATQGGGSWGQVTKENKMDHLVTAAAQLAQMPEKKLFLHEQMAKQRKKRKPFRFRKVAEPPEEKEEEIPERTGSSESESESRNGPKPVKVEARPVNMETAEMRGELNLTLVKEANAEKDTVKFVVWDYGGQEVFYSLHHLFLTKYGVYLLVFNVLEYMTARESSEQYLTFWMKSIRMHAKDAPLLLIGTFVDKLDEASIDLQTVEVALAGLVKEFTQLQRNKTEKLSFFPLDNRNSSGVKSIRDAIEECTRQQAFLYSEVPVRWLRCLDLVTKDEERSWVSLKELKQFAKEADILGVSEVEAMLHYFNELGVVLYFDNTISLQQKVIIRPQWLIDQLGLVIRDAKVHKHSTKHYESLGLGQDLRELCDNAIASRDLLDEMFGSHTTADFLIDLMRRVMLLSDWGFSGSDSAVYLVPSLLPTHGPAMELEQQAVEWMKCKCDFGASFLPVGCFQRLVCLMIEYAQRQGTSEIPKVYQDCALIVLDQSEHTLFLRQEEEAIFIGVAPAEINVAEKYLQVVKTMLRKLNTDAMSGGLKWDILYEEDADKFVLREELTAGSAWSKVTAAKETASFQHTEHLDLDSFMDAL